MMRSILITGGLWAAASVAVWGALHTGLIRIVPRRSIEDALAPYDTERMTERRTDASTRHTGDV